ncbi:MAG: UDP-N-acetylglucosamine--N-acetylmuramyl-(pentapeptide) pyrophosphoryl-undecaprenol N-acetylglucosamine transferase [Clostridia bacterium]|nr:UDP-N-acetylglucosamine--N-acetylmuramyl-(pentapeptide) pyrophosphoryl-undecaprenol N-acetylglucosamine transferase [Clostridia bacterium]
MKRILFTGGGSAGHVVPNLAIMNELKYTHRISYMGTGGIELTLIGNCGYPFFRVDCPKLVRSFTLENLKIPHRLKQAKKEALAVLEREKPDLVFSKGGFASYPAVRAAQKMGIPVLTHESDLSPGLCTKLIAKKCKLVLTSFPETATLFPNGKCVGSPIRREVLNGEKSRAMRKFCLPAGLPVLLVLGGGSGSLALNNAIRNNLPVLLKKFRILHLCGKGNLLDNPPEGYVQREFETDMGSAYACADLVLSRAGSNTVFEILALKKPAVLVPLEKNSRGDQLENALYFEKRGLCAVLREANLSELPETLSQTVTNAALAANLKEADIRNGTPAILELIKSCI